VVTRRGRSGAEVGCWGQDQKGKNYHEGKKWGEPGLFNETTSGEGEKGGAVKGSGGIA